MQQSPNIQFLQLNVGFDHNSILIENIELDLPTSGLVTFIGLNGSGKSTLLKTILGSIKPLSGSININEENVSKYSNKELAEVFSVVFSRLESIEYFTVRDLIALGRIPHTGLFGKLTSKDQVVINKAIASCSIQHLENIKCSRLSDGELQKAFIARALAQDTPVLLLDEPTSHLDARNRMNITRLLKQIAATQNKLIIMSSHDISLSLQLADQVWLLHQKRLISATPQEIVNCEAFKDSFTGDGIHFDALHNTFIFK